MTERVLLMSAATSRSGALQHARSHRAELRSGLLGRTQRTPDRLVNAPGGHRQEALTQAGDLRGANSAIATAGAVVSRFGEVEGPVQLVDGWVGSRPPPETEPGTLESLPQHVHTTFHPLRTCTALLIKGGCGRTLPD
jgi:hypothetical protein